MGTTVTYPLDLSGVNPANLVQNELHTVAEAHFRDYYFIVPNFAPFYVDNFAASITVNGSTRPLVEDVDFVFALPYVTGTRVTGKPMYGALSLNNLDESGIITMNYQTAGGDQVVDRITVLSYLADKAYNPRTTIWDVITDAPGAFPPSPHYQDYDQYFGQEELVSKLNDIKDAILSNSQTIVANIGSILSTYANPDLANYVRKDGDTMTGFLTLNSDPLNLYHAASKQYVDNNLNNLNIAISNDLSGKVNKSGDNMSGFLTLSANPTQSLHAATKIYVDTAIANSNKVNRSGDTMTGPLILSGDPVNALQAVTMQYVDAKFNELNAKIDSVILRLLKT